MNHSLTSWADKLRAIAASAGPYLGALLVVFAWVAMDPLLDAAKEYDDIQRAHEEAQEQARRTYVLQQACGGPEATVEQEGGGVYCRNKRGYRQQLKGGKS